MLANDFPCAIARSQTSRRLVWLQSLSGIAVCDVSLLGTHSNAHKLVTTHKHHPLYPRWSFSAERGRSAIDKDKNTTALGSLSRGYWNSKCAWVPTYLDWLWRGDDQFLARQQ